MRFAAGLAALALVAGAALAEPDIKPWKGKATLPLARNDMAGKAVDLKQLQGRVLVVNFWATWCEPCKMEIPWFAEFQTKYGPRGFQAIGVSVDDTVEKLKPYVAKYKMNYPVLIGLNHDDIQNAYGPLWGIPVTAIVSRDGRICVKHSGISSKQNFEKEIQALLTPFD